MSKSQNDILMDVIKSHGHYDHNYDNQAQIWYNDQA